MASVEPFVVVNSSDRRFAGFVECTVPIRTVPIESAVYWRHQKDPSRMQPAYMGSQVGLDAQRCYALFEEGCPAAQQVLCDLVIDSGAAPSLPERARPRPEPVQLLRVQTRGREEVSWLSDQTLTEGPLAVRRVVGRDGPFVLQQIAWRFADEPWTRFELSYLHSDPTNQDLQAEHEDVFCGHEDAYVHIYGPTVDKLATRMQAGPFGWARRLWEKDVLGNGQGHSAVRGVLLHYLHARAGREDQDLQSMDALQRGDVRATAGSWEGSAGPFRAVPALSPYLGDGREAALSRYQKWKLDVCDQPLAPWAETSMGMANNPGQTGGQEDFPIGPAPEILSPKTVAPYGLQELEAAGYAEFRRPIHYREADGQRIDVKAHPEWTSWSQQTMYSPTRSPDRLGKPQWWGPFETHGFGGRDQQHESINRLGAAVLLGGSRMLQEELDDQITHWLKRIMDTTNRGRGRSLHAACWLHRLTGRKDLLDAMNGAAKENAETWPSFASGARWEIDASSFSYPDGRVLGGRTPFWVGWSESLCSPGLWAAYRETGNETFKDLAVRSARTLLRYGWFKRDGLPGWRLASGVAYRGFTWNPQTMLWDPNGEQGLPLPPEAYADPLQVEDAGDGFHLWAYASVKVAQLFVDEPEVQLRCKQIMEQIRDMRSPTKTFDDMDRWLAVA